MRHIAIEVFIPSLHRLTPSTENVRFMYPLANESNVRTNRIFGYCERSQYYNIFLFIILSHFLDQRTSQMIGELPLTLLVLIM